MATHSYIFAQQEKISDAMKAIRRLQEAKRIEEECNKDPWKREEVKNNNKQVWEETSVLICDMIELCQHYLGY